MLYTGIDTAVRCSPHGTDLLPLLQTGHYNCMKRKYTDLKHRFKAIRCTFPDREAEFTNDSLPDRMINPEVYEPILPAAKEHSVAEPTEDKVPVNEGTRRLTPVYTYGSIN